MAESSFKVNGIDLYTYTNPRLNSFCTGLYVRAGSMFENSANNGISHLLEHAVYRNLKKHYDNFYELLALHGLDLNACTYKEFLYFSIDGPEDEFAFAADLITKILSEIKINNEEFRVEKERIKAEIRENDEKSSLDYAYNKAVWCNTCIEKSIIGRYSTLNRISLKKLNEYRNAVFSAGNIFIYITGNVREESVEELKFKLGNIDINPCNPNFENKVINIGDFFHRSQEITIKQDYWHYIEIGFDVDTQKYPGGIHDLIYAILFKGDKALLYNTMSEDNPIIYSYDSTYEQYDDVSNINFKFEVDENNVEDAFKIVVETLNRLKNGNFNFEANYRCELSSWKMLMDNPKNLNWSLAYYNHILKTEPIDYESENFGRLNGITKEQVMKAAKEIFKTPNMTVAMKGNKRKINTQRINEILSLLDLN